MTMAPGKAGIAAETLDQEELIARGWAALPASYRMPALKPTLSEAREWCRQLATSHYENFHVASWFLPKALRPHFHAIYAYCRVSDDLGDEVGNTAQSMALLDFWERELDACYEGEARHPVFVALEETIRACSIPKEPFADLLKAFRQDQSTTRYATMLDLLEYCRYSANPVGRLVLYACGEADEEKFRLSDATCSALQLANFWQDVSGDWAKGRVYIPQQDMGFYGVNDETIAKGTATPEFRDLMRLEVDFARGRFEEGLDLIPKVQRDLALDLELFSGGGLAILRAIERRNYDVLSRRPSLSKATKFNLALKAVSGKLFPFAAINRHGKSAEKAD